jgi:hypothetical protein
MKVETLDYIKQAFSEQIIHLPGLDPFLRPAIFPEAVFKKGVTSDDVEAIIKEVGEVHSIGEMEDLVKRCGVMILKRPVGNVKNELSVEEILNISKNTKMSMESHKFVEVCHTIGLLRRKIDNRMLFLDNFPNHFERRWSIHLLQKAYGQVFKDIYCEEHSMLRNNWITGTSSGLQLIGSFILKGGDDNRLGFAIKRIGQNFSRAVNITNGDGIQNMDLGRKIEVVNFWVHRSGQALNYLCRDQENDSNG